MFKPEVKYAVRLTSEDWSFVIRALNDKAKYDKSEIASLYAQNLAELLCNEVLDEYQLNKHLTQVLQ